jgi:hypothetical protein
LLQETLPKWASNKYCWQAVVAAEEPSLLIFLCLLAAVAAVLRLAGAVVPVATGLPIVPVGVAAAQKVHFLLT